MSTRGTDAPTAVGVDVGGTKIAAGLVDTGGRVGRYRTLPTPKDGTADAAIVAIARFVADLRRHARGPVRAVGVGTGGVVDHASGVIVDANELLPGWAQTPLGPALAEHTGLPVVVDNDANAHALGELRVGAASDVTDMLFAAVGTGVGGALALGGQLRRGPHHTAGELGHLVMPEAAGRRCNCGGTGHLEAVAAGPGILADYRRRGGVAPDLRAAAAQADAGDPVAAGAIEHGARALGRALAGLAAAVDPHVVVVGGGVAEIGDAYWAPLRSAFHAEPYVAAAGIPVRPARLGPRASIVGAAVLALDHARTEEQPP